MGKDDGTQLPSQAGHDERKWVTSSLSCFLLRSVHLLLTPNRNAAISQLSNLSPIASSITKWYRVPVKASLSRLARAYRKMALFEVPGYSELLDPTAPSLLVLVNRSELDHKNSFYFCIPTPSRNTRIHSLEPAQCPS